MVKIFSKKSKIKLFVSIFIFLIVLAASFFSLFFAFDSSNSIESEVSYADETNTDGAWINNIAKPAGDGSSGNPYLISSAKELSWVMYNVNIGNEVNKYYKQTADIDLSAHYWTPIGSSDNYFSGNYDAQYFNITGMNLYQRKGSYTFILPQIINGTVITTTWDEGIGGFDAIGLFGYCSNDSYISHLNLSGSIYFTYLSSENAYIGGISGYGGNISFCQSNVEIDTRELTVDNLYVGGISGCDAEIYYSSNLNDIQVTDQLREDTGNKFRIYVGGLAGSDSLIKDSYNNGNVDVLAYHSFHIYSLCVGGLAGRDASIYNSYNSGNVELQFLCIYGDSNECCYSVGGLLGYSSGKHFIIDCMNLSSMVRIRFYFGAQSGGLAGGLAGYLDDGFYTLIFHIHVDYDTIKHSYACTSVGMFFYDGGPSGEYNNMSSEIISVGNADSDFYRKSVGYVSSSKFRENLRASGGDRYNYTTSFSFGYYTYINESYNRAETDGSGQAYWSEDWDFDNAWYYNEKADKNDGYPLHRIDISQSGSFILNSTGHIYDGENHYVEVTNFSFKYRNNQYSISNPSIGVLSCSNELRDVGVFTITYTANYYKVSDSLEYYLRGTFTQYYTIQKRDISFTVTNRSMTYGDSYTVPENSYTITSGSVASGDTISPTYKILSGSKDVTSTIKTCDVGSYTISFSSGLNSNNYNITITQGTLTINRRTVDITPVVSMTYGDSAPSESYSVSNLVNSDSISNVIEGTATYKYNGSTTKPSKTSQAGTSYTVSISGFSTKEYDRGKNYRISYKTSELTISKKKANIKVYIGDQLDKTALSITYGENLPIMTYKVDGLINGETASGGEFYIRKATSNYSIEVSDVSIADGDYLEYSRYGYYIMVRNVVLSNNYSPNYAFTSGTSINNNNYAAKLTVNKKAVTIIPSDVSIKYGDPVPTSYVFDVSELPNRDYVHSYPTYAVYNNSSKISYLADNYLGTSHYISDMVNVGSYTLKRDSNYLNIYNSSGKDVSASYNITYKQGTFTITQFDFSRDSYSYTGLTNFVFNGLERTQGLLKIKNSNQEPYNNEGEYFSESIHYTIGYENNIEAGTAKVIISGEGTNCIGSMALEFDIEPFDLNNATITLSYNTVMYDGTSKEPEVTITCDGRAINQTDETYTHRNYSVRYENNLNSGTATVTAYGQDGYNMINSISITFEIIKNAIELEAFYDGSSAFYYGDTTSFYSYKINGLVDHDKTESYIKSISGNGDVIYQFVDGYDALYNVKDTNGNVVNTQTAVAGSYTINVSFVSIPAMILNNYDLSYKTNELVINPRTIYVYATSQSIDYSGSAPSYTYSVDNIVNSDRVTGNATYRVFTIDGVEVTNVSTASKGSYYIYVYIENLDILNSSNQSVLSSYNVVIKNGDADFAEGGRLIIGTYTLNASMLYIDPDSFTYDTTAKTPDIRVIFDSSDLRKDFDYSCVIEDNIVAGKAKITITGLNNFSGTIYGEYTINKLNLTNNSDVAVILDNYNFIFNGNNNEPRVTVKYKDYTLNNIYTDYTFDFVNNKDVGTAKVIINGVNSCEGYVEEEFTISKFDLSDADVNLTVLRDTYSGYGDNLGGDENITTDVKVRLVDNSNQTTQLVNNTDYTITYEDVDTLFNGEGKVIITGKGNYSGEAIATFETSALWDSFIGSTTLSGSGTQSDPYIISTALEFVKLSNFINTNPHSTRYVKLTQNIDLSGRYFTPIGTTTGDVKRFSGVFDGNNRTIIGLTIKSDIDSTGLFGNVSNATINNLGIMNANVTSTADNVGIIAGNAWNTKIQNCYTSGNVSGKNYVGGMIGYFSNTEIANCYQRAEVSGSSNVGGFAGGTENDGINIKDSYVQCIINGEGAIGGLIGKASCTNEASDNAVINISASFYEGIINAQSTSIDSTNAVGGIIGYVNCRANVEGSLACKLSDFYVVVTIETTLASSNYVNNIIGYQAAVNAPAMENYYNNVTIKYLGNTLSSKKYSGEFSNDVWFYSERFNKGTPSLKSIFKIGYGILYNNIESVFPGKDFTSVE